METRALDFNQIIEIYENRIFQDFSENEVKPTKLVELYYEDGKYSGYGYFDGEELLAYAFFIVIDDAYLSDHIAVTGTRKNCGIGTKFLNDLTGNIFKGKKVIGEVEDPEFAKNESDKTIMERRIGFYDRNGWKVHGIKIKLYFVDYLLISIDSNLVLSDSIVLEDYKKFINYQKDLVMKLKPEFFDEWKKGISQNLL